MVTLFADYLLVNLQSSCLELVRLKVLTTTVSNAEVDDLTKQPNVLRQFFLILKFYFIV